MFLFYLTYEFEVISGGWVNNDVKGYQSALAWMEQRGIARDQVHVCLEATGHYGDGLPISCSKPGSPSVW